MIRLTTSFNVDIANTCNLDGGCLFCHLVLSRSCLSEEERSMRDCKSRKGSTDFIVGVSACSVK
jgi:hypothetical protein